MRKILVCLIFVAAMMISCAYADEEVDEPEIFEPVETIVELDDVSVTDHPDLIDESMVSSVVDTDSGDSDDETDIDVTPEPVSDTEPTPEHTEEPTPTPEATPEPTPESSPAPGELTELDMIAGIYGILIFFVVVTLCFFAYKFFRIFF